MAAHEPTGADGTCLDPRILLRGSLRSLVIERAPRDPVRAPSIPRRERGRRGCLRSARSTDCFDILHLHPPSSSAYYRFSSCSTGRQKPLSRVKYVGDGTASRDNSELCLSSSRPALPPSRASAFVNLARDPEKLSPILLRSPDSFPVRVFARLMRSARRSTIRLGSIHRTKTVLNSPPEGRGGGGGSVSKR